MDWHFGGCHTDDYPAIRIRLEFENQFLVELSTSSNHAHLLPWEIKTEDERTSFNPQMSICLAKLLPDDFLFRNRLLESSGIFRSDTLIREERERWELQSTNEQSKKSIEQTGATKDSEGLPNQGTKPQYSAKKLRRLGEEELRELVASGYDLSSSDETGQTALMLAAFPPFNQEQFRKLVRVGANVNAKRTDGMTGLMLACAGLMEETAKEWLLAGADVHLRGPGNCTAIMLGATDDNIVRLLLEAGANSSDQDDDGDSALDYAMHDLNILHAGKRIRAIESLVEHVSKTAPEIIGRSYTRAKKIARQTRLEIEILHEFGGRTISESTFKQSTSDENESYRSSVSEFIDLEITETDLADRIVNTIERALGQKLDRGSSD